MIAGYVTYQGPSMIDGAEIVSIVTGYKGSRNPKTGPMLQHWILRADRSPVDALAHGADGAICGDCPLRGTYGESRACYVNPMGPQSVFRAWTRGDYTAGLPSTWDRPIRFGSYGDPAALPVAHVADLVSRATHGHTGYTHQWRDRRAAPLREWLMASVETPEDADRAARAGWRSFRVSRGLDRRADEIVCPASAEGGYRATCSTCRLCQGASRPAKSILILAHGNGGKYV